MSVPDGYKSIKMDSKIRKIDDVDLEAIKTDEAKNREQIADQERQLLRLISDNEYHLISRRFAKDKPAWEAKLDEWAAQLEEVKAGNLVEIADKPF